MKTIQKNVGYTFKCELDFPSVAIISTLQCSLRYSSSTTTLFITPNTIEKSAILYIILASFKNILNNGKHTQNTNFYQILSQIFPLRKNSLDEINSEL